VLLSAIAGKAARRVFALPQLVIVTTDENAAEVREYLPEFAVRYDLPEELLLDVFELLPIEIYSVNQYSSHLGAARELLLVRDPDDVPLAALALKLRIPIWSNDRDFEDFPYGSYPTAKLLKLLGL
jgi:predicted nucleic acid-binding protein